MPSLSKPVEIITRGYNPNQELYRYYSFKRFLELLFYKQLVALNPTQWPDKFELYWLKNLQSQKGRQELDGFLRDVKNIKMAERAAKDAISLCNNIYASVYAVCFTQEGNTEPMWRANSDNNNSVMIITKRKKVEALEDAYPYLNCQFKEIKYDLENNSNLTSFLEKMIVYPGSIGYYDYEEWFVHKRKCFDYENEIRFLVVQNDLTAQSKDKISLDIPKIEDFIDGVMVNPLAKEDHIKLLHKICDHFGINFLGPSKIYAME